MNHLLSLNAVDYYCFTNTFTNTGSSYTIYSLSMQSTTIASQTHSPTQVVPIPSTLSQCSRLLLLHKHIHQHRQFLYHLLSLNAVDYYCFTNTFANTGSSYTIYSLSTQSTTIASQTHSPTQVVPLPSTLSQCSRLLLLHKHIHQHRQFLYHLLSLNAVDYYCFTNTFTNTGSSSTIYSLSTQSTTIASQTHSPTQVVPLPSTLSQRSRLLLLHKHIHQHRQFLYHLLSLNAVDYYCFTNTFTNTGSSSTIYSLSMQSTTIASQTHSQTQVPSRCLPLVYLVQGEGGYEILLLLDALPSLSSILGLFYSFPFSAHMPSHSFSLHSLPTSSDCSPIFPSHILYAQLLPQIIRLSQINALHSCNSPHQVIFIHLQHASITHASKKEVFNYYVVLSHKPRLHQHRFDPG